MEPMKEIRRALLEADIDKPMMDELKAVKRVLNLTEVLLIIDAMTGQEAAEAAGMLFWYNQDEIDVVRNEWAMRVTQVIEDATAEKFVHRA